MQGSNQLLKYFLNHRRLSIFQEELQLTIVWICFLALTRTLRELMVLSFGAWVASLAHRSPRCRCKLCKDAPKLLRNWGANFITDWKRSFKDWWEPFCLSEDYDFYQFCYVLHIHPIMFHLLTAFLSACARGLAPWRSAPNCWDTFVPCPGGNAGQLALASICTLKQATVWLQSIDRTSNIT